MRIKWTTIARSLRGISIAGFSVNWEPPETERRIIREMIRGIEDRRVIQLGHRGTRLEYITLSIRQIRQTLTDTLYRLDDDSTAVPLVRKLRTACRKCLDELEHIEDEFPEDRQAEPFSERIDTVLEKFQRSFWTDLARLIVKYHLSIDGDTVNYLNTKMY